LIKILFREFKFLYNKSCVYFKEGFMKKSNYIDYTDAEIEEIVRIIKDISTDETEELRLNLEEQLNKKVVLC